MNNIEGQITIKGELYLYVLTTLTVMESLHHLAATPSCDS